MDAERSLRFTDRTHGRYWWFHALRPNYVPPIFSFLTDDEWSIVDQWYAETERTHEHGTGECNVPAMSMLLGLIMGNNVRRIVQCGHFIGFSTLIIGFMLRRMGHRQGLYSIDFNPDATAVTERWVKAAGLQDHVHLVVSDSAAPELVPMAGEYLRGKPQLVFIDSSHERDHTLEELKLWIPAIQPGGFAVLHDVSEFARDFDGKGRGGVKEAVSQFTSLHGLQHIMINDFAGNDHHGDRIVYKDACGLGLIQIPS